MIEKPTSRYQIVLLQNGRPAGHPPILLFEAGLLYESCKQLTCVSTRFCLILGSLLAGEGRSKANFSILTFLDLIDYALNN